MRTNEYYINKSTISVGFDNILDSQAEVIAYISGSKMTR